MKPIHTLILIASEHDARFLENKGVGKGIQQLAQVSNDAIADQLKDYADQPTSGHASVGEGRFHVAPSGDPRQAKRLAFARYLVKLTGEKMQRPGYDRLVVSAAPAMLGVLRDQLDGTLKGRLYADIDKDLVAIPTADLAKHFNAVLAV